MEKKLSKKEKWIIKEILWQKTKFEETCRQFYPDNIVVDFNFPAVGDDDMFKYLYEESVRNPFNSKEQRERDNKSILQIHQNAWECKAGNIEVRFDEGTIQFGNSKCGLANMIAMIRFGCDCVYAFFNEGDRYDAQIFIENASEKAFLVLKYHEKDSNKEAAIISLDEFYLLARCCNEESVKGTGIMVGYDWMYKNIYCDFVENVIFSPVKELLSADWLQEKWKKIKEANEKKIESMP